MIKAGRDCERIGCVSACATDENFPDERRGVVEYDVAVMNFGGIVVPHQRLLDVVADKHALLAGPKELISLVVREGKSEQLEAHDFLPLIAAGQFHEDKLNAWALHLDPSGPEKKLLSLMDVSFNPKKIKWSREFSFLILKPC